MSGPIDSRATDPFSVHRLRSTRQRRAIYDVLCNTDTHPTVDQLFRQVRHRMPGISLATVYNTLEAFCGAGLVVKLPGKGTPARYDATIRNHLHTRCDQTGHVRDVPEDLGQELLDRIPQHVLDQIESDLGFTIRQVQVELVGEYNRERRHDRFA